MLLLHFSVNIIYEIVIISIFSAVYNNKEKELQTKHIN